MCDVWRVSAPGRLDRERLLPVIAWTVAFAGLVAAGFAVVAAASASATFDPADVNVPVVSVALIAATTASFLIVGGRVAAGVVSNPIGWLLLAIGCCIAATLAGMAF